MMPMEKMAMARGPVPMADFAPAGAMPEEAAWDMVEEDDDMAEEYDEPVLGGAPQADKA